MKKEELKALVDKIQSMTGKEIILTMVEALRNPVTRIDMSTFGLKDIYGEKGPKGICYGCAATNLICKLGEFNPSDVIDEDENRSYKDWSTCDKQDVRDLKDIISDFESAIDFLRTGFISDYNELALKHGFGFISFTDYVASWYLDDDYTEDDLKQIEDFANTL